MRWYKQVWCSVGEVCIMCGTKTSPTSPNLPGASYFPYKYACFYFKPFHLKVIGGDVLPTYPLV